MQPKMPAVCVTMPHYGAQDVSWLLALKLPLTLRETLHTTLHN